MSTMEELLNHRHTAELEWSEPWAATGPEGNDLSAHITLRARVHDCINMARSLAKARRQPTMGNDASFLQAFMTVHWASEVKNDPK